MKVSVVKVSFLLKKTFRGSRNDVISLVKIDVTFISGNEIASFNFPRKIFLKRKLTVRSHIVLQLQGLFF